MTTIVTGARGWSFCRNGRFERNGRVHLKVGGINIIYTLEVGKAKIDRFFGIFLEVSVDFS